MCYYTATPKSTYLQVFSHLVNYTGFGNLEQSTRNGIDTCDAPHGLPPPISVFASVLGGERESPTIIDSVIGPYRRVKLTADFGRNADNVNYITMYNCFHVQPAPHRYEMTRISDREFTVDPASNSVDKHDSSVYVRHVADMVHVPAHDMDNVQNAGTRIGLIVYAVRSQYDVERLDFIMISDNLNATFTFRLPGSVNGRAPHGSMTKKLYDQAYAYVIHDQCSYYVNCLTNILTKSSTKP